MNTLLIYFALPIATIVLAAVLQKIIKSPIIVATIFFAIYLVVAFAAFDETFLIATIIYTILAFITAVIVKFICGCMNNDDDENDDTDDVLGIRDVIDAINNCCNNGRNCSCSSNSNGSTCNCRNNMNGNTNNGGCSCSASNSNNTCSCNANSTANSSYTNGCRRRCRFR